MRFLWIACFAVLAVMVQSAPNKKEIVPQLPKHTSRKDITDLLKKALEKFKILMVKGDAELDIPVMDPYVMDHRDLKLDKPSLRGEAIVDNMSVLGMSTFQIQSLDAQEDSSTLTVKFELLVDEVKFLADHYKFHAMVGEKFDLFGEGFFNMTSIGMKTVGEADGIIDSEQHLQLTKLNLFITANQVVSALTGLMNDEEECKLANELISEFGPGILDQYGGQLGNYFGEIVRNIINSKIAGLTVDQIIDMINNM